MRPSSSSAMSAAAPSRSSVGRCHPQPSPRAAPAVRLGLPPSRTSTSLVPAPPGSGSPPRRARTISRSATSRGGTTLNGMSALSGRRSGSRAWRRRSRAVCFQGSGRPFRGPFRGSRGEDAELGHAPNLPQGLRVYGPSDHHRAKERLAVEPPRATLSRAGDSGTAERPTSGTVPASSPIRLRCSQGQPS